ncbi:MAG: hypothetical protein AAF750_00880 [Planctomycetota bacterium]
MGYSGDLRVNFGGSTDAAGWNSFGGGITDAKPLIDADGSQTPHTLEMTDPFQSFENPNVVEGELTGRAAAFEACRAATLFTASEKGNPTGGFTLTLDPGKTYTLEFWASRTGNGTRWTKFTVEGAEKSSQMLAAGDRSTRAGNRSKTALFADVQPDANGQVRVIVSGPAETEPYVNMGGFSYLTGMIVSEADAASDTDQ